MIDFKVTQFEREVILWAVRWYVAYPISYRQLEEMMGERGVAVDHSTLNRWVIKYAPEFEKAFRRRQCCVGRSWRMDETYVRIRGNGPTSIARCCDPFTILVVYYGLAHPPRAAILMGTGAGLVQDALVNSILGLNGFKKTLIGYLVGSLGSLFMLNQAIPRFGILFAASLLVAASTVAAATAGKATVSRDAGYTVDTYFTNTTSGVRSARWRRNSGRVSIIAA